MHTKTAKHWDIFCRVIDNFGDIGVCWRLARQLVTDHAQQVRLWLDDLSSLALLQPETDLAAERQSIAGIEVWHWPADFAQKHPQPEVAQGVIEAFACELPETYLRAMVQCARAPLWINLDYLSAEPWTLACHGLPSPHPRWPLQKQFYFPGFIPESGGLLRECGLIARRDAFLAAHNAPPPEKASETTPLKLSLFCYDHAPIQALLDVWRHSPRPIHCHLPPGKPRQAVERAVNPNSPPTSHSTIPPTTAHRTAITAPPRRWQPEQTLVLGQLTLAPRPFLSQNAYDEALWSCDINFVRGEDSFVRAQWAGKPFIWHIYPQAEQAHLDKLTAFIDVYTADLPSDTGAIFRQMQFAWNTGHEVAAAWAAFSTDWPAQADAAAQWAKTLEKQEDIASRFVNMARERV